MSAEELYPLYPSITVTLNGDDPVALTVDAMHAEGMEPPYIYRFLAEVQDADDAMVVVRRWVDVAPGP